MRGERDEDGAWQPRTFRQWIITGGVVLLVLAPILIGSWLLQRRNEYAPLPLILVGFGPLAMLALISALIPHVEERLRRWRDGESE
ncbi:MAG: hypothetical protein ACU0BO_09570 [Limimaricola soesokkakensis]|uniref:hypothetical protein n=1 Tax=Limimaricola soesokkakensis TaxID=1343159 RepID=UPI00405939F7